MTKQEIYDLWGNPNELSDEMQIAYQEWLAAVEAEDFDKFLDTGNHTSLSILELGYDETMQGGVLVGGNGEEFAIYNPGSYGELISKSNPDHWWRLNEG